MYMKCKRTIAFLIAIMCMLFIFLPTQVAAKKQKFKTWQEVALAMHDYFQTAMKETQAGQFEQAYDAMNNAYFQLYELQGFEKNVLCYVSSKRVNRIEGMFRGIKFALLEKKEENIDQIMTDIELLDIRVYRDALVLDGVAALDSPDSVGLVVVKGAKIRAKNPPEVEGDDGEKEHQVPAEEKAPEIQEVDPAITKSRSFLTSFGLLLREGLEAILVCVAIITYLIKSGNKHMCKSVYLGILVGILGSGLLAVLVHFVLGGAGGELLEGWTMFLAVAVLFWVSHWMLSRSQEAQWEQYIQGKVQKSIDKKSQWVLVGAAFLAVIREGAELVLFYRAGFSSARTDTTYAVLGFIAATAILIVVYVLLRYTTVKLPLKPFFIVTSVLLYVLCISFMGKGVKELTEAGVIQGATSIPAMRGFEFDMLGIYDRAETLIPQIMLLLASVFIMIKYGRKPKPVSVSATTKDEEVVDTKENTVTTTSTNEAENASKESD